MGYKTVQREQLYQLFLDEPSRAFTVKEIASILSDSDISISAIYRNLARMVADGLIQRSIIKNNREALYQYIGCSEHCARLHMTCTECGKTIHVSHKTSDTLEKVITEADGFQINTRKTILFGVCRECERKKHAV